jgi:hypothetical protein
MPIETRQTGKKEQKICVPKPVVGSITLGPTLTLPPEEVCNSAEIPVYTDTPNWIIFLPSPMK